MEWVTKFHGEVEAARDVAHAEWVRRSNEARAANEALSTALSKLNTFNNLLGILSDLKEGQFILEPPL